MFFMAELTIWVYDDPRGLSKSEWQGELPTAPIRDDLCCSILHFPAAEAADEALQPFYEKLYSQYDMLIDIEWLISTLINWGVTVALMAIAAMLSIITVLLSGSIFFFPFFIARGLSVSEALNRSRELTMQHKGIGPRFLLSFLPLLLLSALTLGLLFVFYVLPLMLLTYFSLAEKICDETM